MFYFFGLIFALYGILLYAIFRGEIFNQLRLSKVSKTYIRKNRKGMKNYWLYSQIHKEHPLGILYYLNIAFLFVLLAFSAITILFGYLDFLKIPIFVLAVILCVIEIPTGILSTGIDALAEYGRPFVLLAKDRETKKLYSSILMLLGWLLPVAFVIFWIKDTYGI